MNIKLNFLFVAALTLAACAQTPKKDTAMFCNPNGCEEKSIKRTDMDSAEQKQIQTSPNIKALEELAESKPEAAYDLALKYFRGDGVPQDSYKSIKWMRQAGENGQLQAQKALGLLYLTGLEEMGADPAEAEKWLKIAASRGDKESEALVQQATNAKLAEQQRWQDEQYWRRYAYRYWYHDYAYFGYWRHGRWWY